MVKEANERKILKKIAPKLKNIHEHVIKCRLLEDEDLKKLMNEHICKKYSIFRRRIIGELVIATVIDLQGLYEKGLLYLTIG